jgi:phosphate transport system permease protein
MIRGVLEKTVAVSAWVMTGFLVLAVATLLGYLAFKGLPAIGIDLIFGGADPLAALTGRARVFDGLFPAIVGTLILVLISTLLAVPAGVCSGIYLAEFAGPDMKKCFGLFFDILAGIPSIVIGLFGFSLAVFIHKYFSSRFGPCLLISAFSLAVLVLPYIVRSTQMSLEELPVNTRLTALALGADKLQNIFYVLLPNALSGITSGIILAVGRCAEDTAVILLTGVVATAGVPSSLLSPYEALPFYIYYISGQYTNQAELSQGYGACLILLAICAVLFAAAYMIKKSLAHRAFYQV